MKKVIQIALATLALTTAAFAGQKTTTMTPSTTTTTMQTKMVNLNIANAKTLATLPGIGPKIAKEIIKNRPYKDGKELQAKVKGIGPKVWTQIEKLVSFK